jgi:signal peptidase II
VSKRTIAVVVAAIVVLLDQVTKVWAVAVASDEPITIIDGWFQISVTRNPGASFSVFTEGGQIIALVAIGIVVGIVALVDRVPSNLDAGALGLILGGAAGNLIDRIVRGDGFLDGAVVDWFDPSFFPTFNVADSAITVGTIVLLLSAFLTHERA